MTLRVTTRDENTPTIVGHFTTKGYFRRRFHFGSAHQQQHESVECIPLLLPR
jgi:hypothetical protein